MKERVNSIILEDTRLMFRNFRGLASRYNAAGYRSFCAVVPDNMVSELKRIGWNIKVLRARNEDENDVYFIKVRVRYSAYPPKIVLVSGDTRIELAEADVDVLDWGVVESADLVVSGHVWSMNGSSGVSAYLRTLYATVRDTQDPFEEKYRDLKSDSERLRFCGCKEIKDDVESRPPWEV